jgi:hypothetical protein
MRKLSKLISMVLAVSMLLCLAPSFQVVAYDFPDMPDEGYWSYTALNNAVKNGLLQGTDEGKLLPKDSLTRAQMATILVRAFRATDKAVEFDFADVADWQWFSDALSVAHRMDIINGYPDGTMRPNAAITREEAFVILSRAFNLTEADSINETFADTDDVSPWAQGLVYAMVNNGYVHGSNGKIQPKGLITREEFAQLMDNMIKQYISESDTYTEVAEGNVMINVEDVTLKDVTVKGDLIIGDGVGNGDVVLDGVRVEGRIIVRGGGENSIRLLNNSYAGAIIINKDGDGRVRIYAEDGTVLESVVVDDGIDGVLLEGDYPSVDIQGAEITVYVTNANVENAQVSGEASKFVLAEGANVTNVVAAASGATIEVQSNATVGTLTVQETATGATVEVAGTVTNATVSSTGATITGSGNVGSVEVTGTASEVSIETPKTKITVAPTAGTVTGGGGTVIDPGKTVSNNETGTDIVEEPTTPPYTPPVETRKDLSISISAGGYDAYREYDYLPSETVSSVIGNVLGDQDFNTLIENVIAKAIAKLESSEILIDRAPQDIADENDLVDLYEEFYFKLQYITASYFGDGDASAIAFLDAMDPDKVFDDEGGTKKIHTAEDLAANLKEMIAKGLQLIKDSDLDANAKADLANRIYSAYSAFAGSNANVETLIGALIGADPTMSQVTTILGNSITVETELTVGNLETILSKVTVLEAGEVTNLANAIYTKLGGTDITVTVTVAFE